MLLMHSFVVLRISIISKVHSSDDVSLCPGSSIFKTFADNVLFRTIIGIGKKNYLVNFSTMFSSEKKSFMQLQRSNMLF